MKRHVEYTPIDQVPDAPRNPKQHKLTELGGTIRTFGFTSPAVLDERTGRLVIGHGRLAALRHMRDNGETPPDGITVDSGQWLAPVVRGWASRSDHDAEALLVADNRHTELGGWDDHLLTEMLGDTADHDPALLGAAGFDQQQLDDLLAALEEQPPGQPGDKANSGSADESRHRASLGDNAAEYDDQPTRMLVMSYPTSTYPWIVEKLADIAQQQQLDSNADTLAWLLSNATGEQPPED